MINLPNLSNLPNKSNNILSYFIKDIKDATELAFYKQKNHNTIIYILYKDRLIYKIDNYCYNYIHNIVKSLSIKFIRKFNICHDYRNNYKYLYYKNDNTIKDYNSNFIRYFFTCKKYLNKKNLLYSSKTKSILFVSIIYYKKYKYIRNHNRVYNIQIINIPIYTSSHILIPNKYELDYYCKFFNIYFG
jgi:hypothetical protein